MGKNIKKELKELGFRINSKGFIYWYDAIIYAKTHLGLYDVLYIYEYLAKKHKTTPVNVERTLRYSIAPAKSKIQEKYNCTEKISNRTFINLIKLKYYGE